MIVAVATAKMPGESVTERIIINFPVPS